MLLVSRNEYAPTAQAVPFHPRKKERTPWRRAGKDKIAFEVTVVSPLRENARKSLQPGIQFVGKGASQILEGKHLREIGLIPLPIRVCKSRRKMGNVILNFKVKIMKFFFQWSCAKYEDGKS